METKEYAEFAIRQLTGLDGSSFVDMLEILTSDKYGEEGSENSKEFRGATQVASQILLDLSKEAKVKAEKIKGLVKEISSVSKMETRPQEYKGGNAITLQDVFPPPSGSLYFSLKIKRAKND